MIKSKNGTFFSKTKKVFRSKPARIIFALLIIGGIMTAVSIAVIFLMKKLKQKCTDKPGMTWNDDLQMCVQQGCTNLSGKNSDAPGVCKPDDYCTSKGKNVDGLPYVFDPESGECTIVCSNDELIPVTLDGKNYINQADINIENKDNYKDITCQPPCQYANTNDYKKKDGNGPPNSPGFCYSNTYSKYDKKVQCGFSKLPTGEKLVDYGCISDYWEKCDDSSDLFCPEKKDCISNSEGEFIGCKGTICGANNSNLPESEHEVWACKTDQECGPGSQYKCVFDDKFKFYDNKIGSDIVRWGYCNNTIQLEGLPNCINKKKYGLSNLPHECPQGTGVNSSHQCNNTNDFYSGSNVPIKTCSKYGLCPNEWQASSSEFSCSEISSPDKANLELICCNSNNIADDPLKSDNKFCCPIKTMSSKDGNKYCTNNTIYPYSKKMLYNSSNYPGPGSYNELNITDGFDCSIDEDCNSLNEMLWKKLGNEDDFPSSWNESNQEKYINMYCDESTKQCKASCGYFDSEKYMQDKPYGVFSSSTSEGQFSYCFQKNQKCSLPNPVYESPDFKPGSISNTPWGAPICYKESSNDVRWAGNNTSQGYLTKYVIAKDNTKGTDCDDSEFANTCVNILGKNLKSITDISVNNNTCEALIPCDQLSQTIADSEYEWQNLNYNVPYPKFLTYKPYKTGNSYYKTSKEECVGDPSPLNEGDSKFKINNNPMIYTSNGCAIDEINKNNPVFKADGIYCPNGMNYTTGDCNSQITESFTESFTNILETSNNNNNNNTNLDDISLTNIYAPPTSVPQSSSSVYETGYLTDGKYNYYCSALGFNDNGNNIVKNINKQGMQNGFASDSEIEIQATCSNDPVNGGYLTCQAVKNTIPQVTIGCCSDNNTGDIYANNNGTDTDLYCRNVTNKYWEYNSDNNTCDDDSPKYNNFLNEQECLQDNLEPRTSNSKSYGFGFEKNLFNQQKNMASLNIDKMHTLLVVLTSTVITNDSVNYYTMPLTVYNNVFGSVIKSGKTPLPTKSQLANGSIGLTGFIGNSPGAVNSSDGSIKQCTKMDEKINSMYLNVEQAQQGLNGSQWKLYSYNKFGITNVNGISYKDCFALQAIDTSQTQGYQGLLTAYTNQGNGIDQYSVGFLWNKVLWYIDNKDEDTEKYAQTAIMNDPMAYAFKFNSSGKITKLFDNKGTKYAVIRPRYVEKKDEMANIYGMFSGSGIFNEPVCRSNWVNVKPLFYPATLFLENEDDSDKNFPCSGGDWPGSFEEPYKSDLSLNNIFVLGDTNIKSNQQITNWVQQGWYHSMSNDYANLCCNSDNPSPVELGQNGDIYDGINNQFCFGPYMWNKYGTSSPSINNNVSTCEDKSTANFMNPNKPMFPHLHKN